MYNFLLRYWIWKYNLGIYCSHDIALSCFIQMKVVTRLKIQHTKCTKYDVRGLWTLGKQIFWQRNTVTLLLERGIWWKFAILICQSYVFKCYTSSCTWGRLRLMNLRCRYYSVVVQGLPIPFQIDSLWVHFYLVESIVLPLVVLHVGLIIAMRYKCIRRIQWNQIKVPLATTI